ncbi:Glu/Leu/Phe/Val dehydrogenase dimerization domain-containing protein [Planctomycetota bacterium]|nr:Glu/Leu/Phe/Val dehydrogenase dimerization domain-containing protein [Planctomycetota bacterium]
MSIFDVLKSYDCEWLTFMNDPESGLSGLIAIHSTKRGPAFGGIRTLSYATQDAAIEDALRLAKAMSYKAAAADLPAGGGKTVIIKHDNMDRKQAFQQLGRHIHRMGGSYFTGLDVGTTRDDLLEINKLTNHVAKDLDFGKATARGVKAAICAALKHKFDDMNLEGRTIAVQGLGAVGAELVTMLHAEGATVIVSDIDERRAASVGEKMGCEVANPSRIISAECDVFAPCALGSVINTSNIGSLGCKVIVGSANNQLASPAAGDALREAGIVYVPDYIANAGALIKGVREHVAGEEVNFSVVDQIFTTASHILERAASQGKATNLVADEYAEEQLAKS